MSKVRATILTLTLIHVLPNLRDNDGANESENEDDFDETNNRHRFHLRFLLNHNKVTQKQNLNKTKARSHNIITKCPGLNIVA